MIKNHNEKYLNIKALIPQNIVSAQKEFYKFSDYKNNLINYLNKSPIISFTFFFRKKIQNKSEKNSLKIYIIIGKEIIF